MVYKITKEIIESLVPGKWYVEPKNDWFATHISESRFNALGKQTLFIAMDQKTWLKGTGNTGVYGQWDNTHEVIDKYPHLINGVIGQYPIKSLPADIPQYIVLDPFEFINKHAAYIRAKLNSKVISITGTVGKTSTKEYLKSLLAKVGSVYATNKNHNSRTGVKLTISNAMHNPDYVIIETAMAALWMKSGGISLLAQPDIAVITEIGIGQRGYDDIETAAFKSKIAEGIKENGLIILNRDIKEYQTLKHCCEVYSQNIFSYGEHAQADCRISYENEILTLTMQGFHGQFELPYTDMGTVHNVSAALCVCYKLGIDLTLFYDAFKRISKSKAVLEEIVSAKNILIVDDTYNAEHLSMLNAFKYCQQKFPKKRRILLVGDIINLGEKSSEVHESLLEPILDTGFSLIATFGQDTKYLQRLLPRDRSLGHFSDARECALALSKIAQENDLILIKGSRRNSTIHTIPKFLDQNLHQQNSLERLESFIYRADLIKNQSNVLQYQIKYGLGSFLLLFSALKAYELKKIDLHTIYIVSDNVSREGKNANALGLKKDEKYTFLELITQVIVTQKPDSILALAEVLYGTTNKALSDIREKAQQLGIDATKVLNVTGRSFRGEVQTKTIEDLLCVAKAIAKLSHRTLSIANQTYCSFNDRVYKTQFLYKYKKSNLLTFYIGHGDDRVDIVISLDNLEKIIFAKNSEGQEDLNYLIPYYLNNDGLDLPIQNIDSESGKINILGDTYFGEFYTRIRKKRGINDALQQYGYGHSFEKIAPFFEEKHLNIINLEATFFEPNSDSSLRKIKPFILDADSQATIHELKKRHINHVMLANNHAKDFGESGLSYTLTQLEANQISYIGAGRTQYFAQKIFEVKYQNQAIAIFNGYWHRNPAYLEFDFYALGEKNGVNSLNSLIDSIKNYKQLNPQNKVIVSAHWGVDFKAIHPAQRRIAKRIVNAGADLIIGHGPHCLQPLEYIGNTPVIFSIGNGVFNSNGEFERYKVFPFGALIRIDIKGAHLDIYPLSTDNKKSFWQPYPLNSLSDIEDFGKALSSCGELYSFDKDKQGRFYTRVNF